MQDKVNIAATKGGKALMGLIHKAKHSPEVFLLIPAFFYCSVVIACVSPKNPGLFIFLFFFCRSVDDNAVSINHSVADGACELPWLRCKYNLRQSICGSLCTSIPSSAFDSFKAVSFNLSFTRRIWGVQQFFLYLFPIVSDSTVVISHNCMRVVTNYLRLLPFKCPFIPMCGKHLR